METDRKGSKTNLNESTMPLLDDQEIKQNQEKEKIELAETGSGDSQEKDDSAPEKEEKQEGDDVVVEKEEVEEDKSNTTEKKKKQKKPKKPKTHKRTFSYADNLTVGLNLLDRDEKHINDQVNLVFEDVIAEPDASHGVDGVWKGAFVLFSGTKNWVYKILAALISIPLAFVWGLVFALMSLVNIWVITPIVNILMVVFHFIRQIVSAIFGATLDPLFTSISLVFSKMRVNQESVHRDVAEQNEV